MAVDQLKNQEYILKSLAAAIQRLDHPIEYQGLHFLMTQKYPSKVLYEENFKTMRQQLAL